MISLRLPKSLLDQLKTMANKRDVPYQTLLKLFVLERVEAELHRKTAKAYIIYRDQHARLREVINKMEVDLVDRHDPATGFAARHGTQNAACSEGGECIGFIEHGHWVWWREKGGKGLEGDYFAGRKVEFTPHGGAAEIIEA